jgi:hypothetical protein
MKKILSYHLELQPVKNFFRIEVMIDGNKNSIVVPINSMEEFTCCSQILLTGRAFIDPNGVLLCQG